MRELSTCDFCDGAAAGVYEVVPDDVAGVASHRMVLCEGCRDTLAGVVDPLLDQLRLHQGGGEPPGETDAEPAVAPGDREPRGDAPDVREDAAAADPEDATPEPEPEPASEQEPASEPAAATDGAAEQGAAAGAAPTRPASRPAERPPGYRKIVRLLENRDAAIPQSDLEDLVTNAYDVTPDEFQAAVDAAVENGHLEATNEGLRRAD